MKARLTRPVNGVLILNKSTGESSNRVLQHVKRLYQAAKAGHTGSLDPLASGVLPICFGEATKFSQFLLDADKAYKVTAKLGIVTASGDAEGEIIQTNAVPEFNLEQIQAAVNKFIGASKQVPSMYSALKHNGQPLYKLARQGKVVERKARDIIITEFKLIAYNVDEIEFEVHCSKGTYIRTLIEDLGAELGCGAHVAKLERIQAGQFLLQQSYSLEQLHNFAFEKLDELLLPIESLLLNIPQVNINALDALNISHGRKITVPNLSNFGLVSIFAPNNVFMGIGEATNEGVISPKRLMGTN